jgi:hypothetical protein
VLIKEIEEEEEEDEPVYIGEYNKWHIKGKTHMYLSIFTNWYSKKSSVRNLNTPFLGHFVKELVCKKPYLKPLIKIKR